MDKKKRTGVKFILQRENGKVGSITRDSDLGLQVGIIDPLSQCKIIGMEDVVVGEDMKKAIDNCMNVVV